MSREDPSEDKGNPEDRIKEKLEVR